MVVRFFVLEWFTSGGSLWLVVVGLLAAGLGVPFPEDPMLLAGGAIAGASQGELNLFVTIGVCFVAVLVGDTTLYWIARTLGARIVEKKPFSILLTPARRARVQDLFDKRGSAAIFFARHVAGLRSLVFILAGVEKMPYRKFIAWDALGALVSVPVVVSLGYFFAANLHVVQEWLGRAHNVIFVIVALVVGAWLFVRYRRKKAAQVACLTAQSALDGDAPEIPRLSKPEVEATRATASERAKSAACRPASR